MASSTRIPTQITSLISPSLSSSVSSTVSNTSSTGSTESNATPSSVSAPASTSPLSSLAAPSPPATSPASPSETDRPRGLTITTTIGIGIGVAAICVILFIIGFVCVRRRRRKFGLKRKERMELGLKGDSPDDEIAKKLEKSEASEGKGELEAGGSTADKAELDGGVVDTAEKKKYAGGDGSVSELPSDVRSTMQELPGQQEAVEMGEGAFFIAELDSKEIERMKSLKATRRPTRNDEAPPLPSPEGTGASTSTKKEEDAIPQGASSSSKDEEHAAPKATPIPNIVVQPPEKTT